jgi:predicted Zn-dependent peptidase
MLFGQSSVFYNELYDEGLIDTNFGSYYTGKKTFGHSLVAGQSIDPDLVFNKIKDLINRPVEEVLKEEDFIRIKKKNLGSFLMGLNSIEFIANNFVELYFDDFNLLDYLSLIETIEFDELKERFTQHLTVDNLVLSIINPLVQ